ncbi:MAG: hypothetical protein WC492_02460 [Candidatus Micrarchaeia archaeon]
MCKQIQKVGGWMWNRAKDIVKIFAIQDSVNPVLLLALYLFILVFSVAFFQFYQHNIGLFLSNSIVLLPVFVAHVGLIIRGFMLRKDASYQKEIKRWREQTDLLANILLNRDKAFSYANLFSPIILYLMLSFVYYILIGFPNGDTEYYSTLALVFLVLKLVLLYDIGKSLSLSLGGKLIYLVLIPFLLSDCIYVFYLKGVPSFEWLSSYLGLLGQIPGALLILLIYAINKKFLDPNKIPLKHEVKIPLKALILIVIQVLLIPLSIHMSKDSPLIANRPIPEQFQNIHLFSDIILSLTLVITYVILCYNLFTLMNTKKNSKETRNNGVVKFNGVYMGRLKYTTRESFLDLHPLLKTYDLARITQNGREVLLLTSEMHCISTSNLSLLHEGDRISGFGYIINDLRCEDGKKKIGLKFVAPLYVKLDKKSVFWDIF